MKHAERSNLWHRCTMHRCRQSTQRVGYLLRFDANTLYTQAKDCQRLELGDFGPIHFWLRYTVEVYSVLENPFNVWCLHVDFAVEVDSAVASNFMKQKLFGGVEHPQLTKKDLKRSGERERERERERTGLSQTRNLITLSPNKLIRYNCTILQHIAR